MENNGVVVVFDVYGFLVDPLWEMYEKRILFAKETMPAFLEQKLKKYIPCPPQKNIELKKPLYLAFLEKEIKSLKEVADVIGIELAVMLAAKSRFYYNFFRKKASEENITVARVSMQFKIKIQDPDNKKSSVCRFSKPEPEIIISIINPSNDSYFMTVKIENWMAPKPLAHLLANA